MNIMHPLIILITLILPFEAMAYSDDEYSNYMMSIAKEPDSYKRLILINDFIKSSNELEKFSALSVASKTAFKINNYNKAKEYAQELLALSKKYKSDWNYGNAIHDGNMILGRISIKEGNIEQAKNYLIKAGKTPGSPQLKFFGPNMSLAKDLTDIGENDIVIKYFALCKLFWEKEDGRLDSWAASIRGGGKPYYGMQLHH